MRSRDITALEETLGYRFRHPELIQQALTHSSQAREIQTTHPDLAARRGDNEQLEFLGDAGFGLVTSQELLERFPGCREGELSKLQAHRVRDQHLLRVGQELERQQS